MAQNKSSAVMNQRFEPHDSLDDFPTPPWATRALMTMLIQQRIVDPWNDVGRDYDDHFKREFTVREPAANRGFMARTLAEYFGTVIASDIYDYGAGYPVEDYLWPSTEVVDWTITNPPFRLAEQFIDTALARSRMGVAMICRSTFSEGVGRYKRVFNSRRPAFIFQFAERVPMVKGRCDPESDTATAYAWYVWLHSKFYGPTERTTFDWIPPCRATLERADDYKVP